MSIKAIYLDPAKASVTFDNGDVDLKLNDDGALASATVGGKPVDLAGLQGLLVDSRDTFFRATVTMADGSTAGPFDDVQHVNLRVNYGMNVVELLQLERLQRVWYSQIAPAATAS